PRRASTTWWCTPRSISTRYCRGSSTIAWRCSSRRQRRRFEAWFPRSRVGTRSSAAPRRVRRAGIQVIGAAERRRQRSHAERGNEEVRMLETIFANPGYLAAGGALISSPIIIHLINRMRFKRLRWAAMEFLLKAQKRNRRRLIIEQLLLLLLRCMLVALLGLLVSRLVPQSAAATGEVLDYTHIVLVDNSL